MTRPAYEWVPDTDDRVHAPLGLDWNLECAHSGVFVGWVYKAPARGFRAGYAFEVKDFPTLAEAARWVEKQAGAR